MKELHPKRFHHRNIQLLVKTPTEITIIPLKRAITQYSHENTRFGGIIYILRHAVSVQLRAPLEKCAEPRIVRYFYLPRYSYKLINIDYYDVLQLSYSVKNV